LLILEALVLLGRLTLAALVLAASASGALGLAAMIGDAFVKLPPPADFCELTPQYEFDGNALNAMSKQTAFGLKLLAMSADCNQLAGAREGKGRISDMVQYLVENPDAKVPMSVASKCAIERAPNKSSIDVDTNLARIVDAAKVNEASSIGVIAEDDSACYSAAVAKRGTNAGAQVLVVALQAYTVVKAKAITVRRHAAFQNPDAIKALLAKLKSDVAAFIAANP
jgi:hypothetical protein